MIMGTSMAHTVYQFTPEELKTIHEFMNLNIGGPSYAYRWYKGLGEHAGVRTGDVEDFAVSFYTQYNRECGRTY